MENYFNPRELDILNILLSADEPLTATEVTDAQEDLTQSTVISVMRKLLASNYVETTGVTHSGKVLARTYKVTDLAKEDMVHFFAEQYLPFVETLGLHKFFTSILCLLNEDQQSKVLAELHEMF